MPAPQRTKAPPFLKNGYLAGKLSKDEAIERLSAVSEYLAKLDQDVSTAPIDCIAEGLIGPSIIRHRDKEVRLLVATSLVDILRLYAPEPPYDNESLKEIFSLLIVQLQGLGNTEIQSYPQVYYLLERLAMVRAVIALLEEDMNAGELLVQIFENFFGLVTSDHSTKAKSHMIEIMATVIEEIDEIPQDIMDVMLAQLIEPARSETPVAWQLARDLVMRTKDILTGPVTTFLNDAVTGKESDSELAERAHDVILELNKIEPNILIYVLPNLQSELTVEDLDTRRRTVNLLVEMFTERGSILKSEYQPLFRELLGRFNDVEPEIREIMVAAAKNMLLYHKQNATAIEGELTKKLQDKEDHIRERTVQVVGQAALAMRDAVSDNLLNELKDRVLDKKPSVRDQAMSQLASIYQKYAAADAVRYKWIPSKILSFYLRVANSDRAQKFRVFRLLTTDMLPKDLAEQTTQLLAMYSNLDTKFKNCLLGVLGEQAKVQKVFLELAKSRSQGKLSQDADAFAAFQAKTKYLCQYFSEPKRVYDVVIKLAEIKNPRVFKLLAELCRGDISFAALQTAEAEFWKVAGKDLKSPAAKETMQSILVWIRMQLLGKDQIICILTHQLKQCKSGEFLFDQGAADLNEDGDTASIDPSAALAFCSAVADIHPTAFASSLSLLSNLVSTPEIFDGACPENALHLMQLLTKVGHLFGNTPAGKLRPVLRKISAIVQDPSMEPKVAKYGVRAIVAFAQSPPAEDSATLSQTDSQQTSMSQYLSQDSSVDANKQMIDGVIDDLTEVLVGDLVAEGSPSQLKAAKGKNKTVADALPATLLALGAVARCRPDSFGNHLEHIQTFVVTDVLGFRKKRTSQYSVAAKVAGIKALVSQLKGLEDCEEAHDAAEPVWKLLDKIIQKDGDLAGERNAPETCEDCGLVRATAAKCMLSLCTLKVPSYETKLVTNAHRITMSNFMQDPLVSVRKAFTQKLWCCVRSRQSGQPTLSKLSYFAMMPLAAAVEDGEHIRMASGYLDWLVRARRLALQRSRVPTEKALHLLPETILPFLVHYLAHAKNYEEERVENNFANYAKCFLMFFESVLTGTDNLAYMMHILEKIGKDLEDATAEDSEVRPPLQIGCFFCWCSRRRAHGYAAADARADAGDLHDERGGDGHAAGQDSRPAVWDHAAAGPFRHAQRIPLPHHRPHRGGVRLPARRRAATRGSLLNAHRGGLAAGRCVTAAGGIPGAGAGEQGHEARGRDRRHHRPWRLRSHRVAVGRQEGAPPSHAAEDLLGLANVADELSSVVVALARCGVAAAAAAAAARSLLETFGAGRAPPRRLRGPSRSQARARSGAATRSWRACAPAPAAPCRSARGSLNGLRA
jgi:sister-chromatid-cohesion protein PDS5